MNRPDAAADAASPPGLAIQIGEALVEGIAAGDYGAVEAVLSPSIRFRALTPKRGWEAASAADARAIVEGWFAETEARELRQSTVDVLADRLLIRFQLAFQVDGVPRLVEQNLVGTVTDGRLADLAVLCTGFRPAEGTLERATSPVPTGASQQVAAAVRADSELDGIGLSCATLTPAINARVLALHPGELLEIVTDDPSAEDGLGAWARLTGHELVGHEPGAAGASRFYVRRSATIPARHATPSAAGGAN